MHHFANRPRPHSTPIVNRRVWIEPLLLASSLISGPADAAACDGKPGTFLFQDEQCTLPVDPRFGDEERGNDYEIFACPAPLVTTVKMTETKRKSRIASDFDAVLDSLKKDDSKALSTPTCVPWKAKLSYKRGTLVVEAYGRGDDGKDKQLQSVTVLTGPTEHWFLGLDLPVTDQKTLKYDSATGTLKPRDKDSQLYVSLNYLLGDVLVDVDEDIGLRSQRKWTDDLAVKFFVKASSRPMDSAGVGLGYRVPKFEVFDFSLQGLSLYGGYFWTKQDEITGGVAVENGDRDGKWRFGVTFDVAAMIEAVKW